jgi:hypothetical protein
MYFDIIHSLLFPFPLLPLQIPTNIPTVSNMLYLSIYDHVCNYVYIYLLGLVSTYERKACDLCPSKPG